MPGSVSGGRKAAATNKLKYGEDFFRKIGGLGGRISRGGGFATNHETAVAAGRKGGLASRRTSKKVDAAFESRERVTGELA